MRIAYLVNRYPSQPHTFIRREIRALEELGMEIERYSIRAASAELVDPLDLEEVERTHVVLRHPGHVLLDLLAIATTRPCRFLEALRTTLRWGSPSRMRSLVYLAEAAALVRRWTHDAVEHVHVHFGTNSTSVGALAKILGGPAFSVTLHGDEPFAPPWGRTLAERLSQAKAVVAISSPGAERIRQLVPREKVHLIRCGLDEKDLTTTPSAPHTNSGLVFVGSLIPRKAPELLLDAAIDLWADGADFELSFIGDGPLRQTLAERIVRADVQSRVQLRGWGSGNEIRRALASSRALVLPSRSEGLPIVLLEAYASARPVVTTAVGGIKDLVDETCGWLVPADDPAALRSALTAVLAADPADLFRRGLEGRRRVINGYLSDRAAKALTGVFAAAQED